MIPKNTYQPRPYRHPDDLAAVLDLVRVRPAGRVEDYPGLVDLQELLCRPDIQAHSRVWFSGPRLAGYAFNDHYPDFSGISFEFDPAEAEVGGELVAWCQQNFRQHRQPGAAQLQLSVAPEDTTRIALLQAHGFAQEDWSLVKMARPLAGPHPTPRLPEGFSIRPFRGEVEMEEWVALHRAAFGTQVMSAADRRTWAQVPDYHPALDLVAVAPDGTLAAYAFYSIHAEENERSGQRRGAADSIGTRPDYRGMGLAQALLLAGLPVLKEFGMESAALTTASYNTAMQRAATRAGFRQSGQILYFAYSLAAAGS